ncbi:MAG: hypothetical protein ACKPB4_27065 [Sphaerospermopsis kisseleviana]
MVSIAALSVPGRVVAGEQPPTENYSSLIVGKWDIRTYGYEFKSGGQVSLFNPDSGEVLETGTWSMDGDRLSLQWESRGLQTVRVRFQSADRWEWLSDSDRIWEATRLAKKTGL